jgi:hypothetical protein
MLEFSGNHSVGISDHNVDGDWPMLNLMAFENVS